MARPAIQVKDDRLDLADVRRRVKAIFTGSIGNFSLGSITGLSSRQSVGGLTLNGNNIALNVFGDALNDALNPRGSK